MKIRFIESSRYLMDGTILKTKELFYPAITFPYLAALTPPDFKVFMTHEILENIDFEKQVDLVGLTSVTNNVYRAYEIADKFRKRNIPVVMGGFHASVEPDEALQHVDAVFIGEAEETWPRFLEDFKKNRIKKIYKADKPPTLQDLPIPDYSIINKKYYIGYQRKGFYRGFLHPMIPIQTARGCPLGCDFCDITLFHNGTYRTRPIDDVIKEIRALDARWVCFVDDNIFADLTRTKELLKALIPLKLLWVGQATISAAEDEELLHLAKKSGCFALLVGIETVDQAGLESVNKTINNVENYKKNLKAYKKAGIDINASMVFGLDTDSPSVFEKTYNFLMDNHVPFAGLQPIRPSPGTPMYKRFKSQGRLKEEKWWLNRDSVANVFDLKFVGTKVDKGFADNLFRLYKRFYSAGSLIRRFFLPPQRRSLVNLIITLRLKKKISRQAFISEK